MQKYGFVYIWRDKKHNRYYLGCHWGTEDDGYICSSKWMRDAYRYRKDDFKRRIIERVYTNRTDLLECEQKWMNFVKKEELGKKYYNLHNNPLLIAASKKHENWGHWNKGKVVSEETKQKLREANKKQFENPEHREYNRQKTLSLWADPEYRKKQTEKKVSEETKKKISSAKRGKNFNPPKTQETKNKISRHFSNVIWINNGKKNARINKDDVIPEGYVKGRFKNVN